MYRNATMLAVDIRSLLAIILFVLVGCKGQEENSESSPDCSLSQIGWQKLTFRPPIRVALWRIRLEHDVAYVNNSTVPQDKVGDILARFKDLDPSPYAIIKLNALDDCTEIFKVAEDINRKFGCDINHCFYLEEHSNRVRDGTSELNSANNYSADPALTQ